LDGQVLLSWSPPDNGGSSITYNIHVDLNGSVNTIPGITTTSRLVDGLENGNTYKFKVSAVNSKGPSELSEEIQSRPFTNAVPPTPILGPIIDTGVDYIPLSWDTPGLYPGALITSYKINYVSSFDGSSGWILNITNKSYIIEKLRSSTTYNIQIYATNIVGDSQPLFITATTKNNNQCPVQ
jgi:titin